MGRKQLYGYFKGQIKEILHQMKLNITYKKNLRREKESQFIAEQNNSIRTNYVNIKLIIILKIANIGNVFKEMKEFMR